METKKIKLIWDFRGPDASTTAMHHERHLKEYIVVEELSVNITGCKNLSSAHSMAYMVVEDTDLTKVRDSLLPHRGELYEGNN